MNKIKNRKQLCDTKGGQGVYSWLRRNNPELLDELFPIKYSSAEKLILLTKDFYKINNRLPKQHSLCKEENRLDSRMSDYCRPCKNTFDPEFKQWKESVKNDTKL
jgi:hypothetical protein